MVHLIITKSPEMKATAIRNTLVEGEKLKIRDVTSRTFLIMLEKSLFFAYNTDINRKEGVCMSEREQAKQIIDLLPEYKISNLLLFLKGIQFDDDIEDDLYCQKLYEDYLNDPDSEKDEEITLEELAAREGIEL